MGWMKGSHELESSTNLTDNVLRKEKYTMDSSNNEKFNDLLKTAILKPSHKVETKDSPTIDSQLLDGNAGTNENQNMAALLRARLKARKGVLDANDGINPTILTSHIVKRKSGNGENLRDLMKNEKFASDDMDSVAARNIISMGERFSSKMLPGTGNKTGADEEEDLKAYSNLYQSNMSEEISQRRQLQQAVRHDEKLDRVMKSCKYCMQSHTYKELSSYIVATGQYTFLRLKIGGSRLHDFHCEIVPMQHIFSIRRCEEEVLAEIKRFKSCVSRMAETRQCSMLFLESSTQYYKMPHTYIDCMPIEQGREKECIAFFKEALMSVGEEWSQHPKIIDLRRDRPLRRAIPSNFEYTSIEWGDDDTDSYGGVVHIIDDVNTETSIDKNFCLDVICGMLEEDPMKLRIKNSIDNVLENKTLGAFKGEWQKHDWTQYLDQL